MGKRQSYSRKNEPKERDLERRERRKKWLNSDQIEKACDRRLAEAMGAIIQHPDTPRTIVIKTNGRARSAANPPVSMLSMIAADRVAYIAKRRVVAINNRLLTLEQKEIKTKT